MRTLLPSTTSGLKLECFLFTPVCNAHSEWRRIAHVRQTIEQFIGIRNLESRMPCILISSKYLLYIGCAICAARNLQLKSWVQSAIGHVCQSPIAGTNHRSMVWVHEPVPFLLIVNRAHNGGRIIWWQIA